MPISKTKSKKRRPLWALGEWERARETHWGKCPGWICYDDRRLVITLILPIELL